MNAKHTLLVLAGLASASAMAQTGTQGPPTGTERPETVQIRVIEAQTENGVTYLCGGVGSNEAIAMKQAASEFDLMLTFAASNGAYLADVNVDLADARGQPILNTNCGGPIMLVDFPEGGKYRIRAEAEGRTLTRTVQVSNRGKVKTAAMLWPVNTVDMGLTPSLRGDQPGESMSGGSGTGTTGSSRR